MTLALLALLAPAVAVVAQTSPENIDFGDAAKLYGVAAPFALLCLAMVLWQRKELAAKDATIDALHLKIEERDRAATERERQLVAGLGPRIYDAAQLFREGADVAARVPSAPPLDKRVEQLTAAVEDLIEHMEPRPPDPRPGDGAR